jgi:hypothetical protein
LAVILKKRLINPSKRKLTARQKLFFGSKQQRAAAKRSLSNRGKVRTTNKGSHRTRRVRNIGEIITVKLPNRKAIKNPMPATRRNSARRSSKRRNAPRTWKGLYARAYYKASGKRKRSNRGKVANGRVARRRNSSRVIVRYRNPAKVYRRKNRSRRRNPGFLTTNLAKVAGILGGATITNLIAKQLPANYTTGTLGYATLTATAIAQGYVVKKFLKNDALGEDMMIGGLVLVAIKLMGDFFPSVSLGLSGRGRGLGMIGNSSFPIPQVPVAGSMGRFQIPPNYQSAINSAVPVVQPAKGGMGAVTMGGVTRARRVGRLA